MATSANVWAASMSMASRGPGVSRYRSRAPSRSVPWNIGKVKTAASPASSARGVNDGNWLTSRRSATATASPVS